MTRDPQTGQRLIGIAPSDWAEPRSLVANQRDIPDAEVIDAFLPDYSWWDRTTFNAACFHDVGIRRAMIQADESCDAASRACSENGIELLVVYTFPYFSHVGTQPQQATERALQKAHDFGYPIVCFDAELDSESSPPTVEDRQRQSRECFRMIEDAKKARWCYSAPWFFVPKLGNTPEFFEAGVKHHLANYGANDGTQAPIRANDPTYAWPFNIAHQFTSLADYCGRRERDRSYLWSDGLPEADMTTDEVNALIEAAIVTATRSSRLVGGPDWLALFGQTIGVFPETFDDDDTLALIRAKLAAGAINADAVRKLVGAVDGFSAALRGLLGGG